MKTLFLILTCLILASCDDNITVQYPDGKREQLKSPLYDVGDTVYVQHSSSSYTFGVLHSISNSYWCDTTIYQQNSDSSYFLWSFHKAVVINK